MDNLSQFEKIGEGSYGIVYKAAIKETGKIVAIKKIRSVTESGKVPSTALREISMLRELQHPNVVSLIDVVFSEMNLFLVFEYLNQDLYMFIEKVTGDFPIVLLKRYLHQLLSGLNYCHNKQIMHRDLKPQNLLLDLEGNIKIADFGLGRFYAMPNRVYTNEVVTLWYRPPEILLGAKMYSTTVDVWSLGCIFGEMVKKSPMFEGDCEIDQLYKIFCVLGTPTEESWPGVSHLPNYGWRFPAWEQTGLQNFFENRLDLAGIDLLTKMLICDPSKRVSAEQSLNHQFFDSMGDIEAVQYLLKPDG